MPLLNYTTSIAVDKTAYEIIEILIRNGAIDIHTSYENSEIVGLQFVVDTAHGRLPFTLPVRTANVGQVMRTSKDKAEVKMGWKAGQPERVAWRILKNCVMSQMALVAVGMVNIEEVFLPYLTRGGSTLYNQLKADGFKALAAPSNTELPSGSASGQQ